MAGQIGIKTNLTVDTKRLNEQIETIKKTLAEKHTFKINIDKATISGLREIHKVIKDIAKVIDADMEGLKNKATEFNMTDEDKQKAEAEKAIKAQEELAKAKLQAEKEAEELAKKQRQKAAEDNIAIQDKIDEERLQQIEASSQKVNDKLVSDTEKYVDAQKKLYTVKKVYSGDGFTKVETETEKYKTDIQLLEELKKQFSSVIKLNDKLSKSEGYTKSINVGSLTKSLKEAENEINNNDVFKEGTYDKLKSKLDSYYESLLKMVKLSGNKSSNLDISSKINKSAKAVDTLRDKYDSLKSAYPTFDPDGSILENVKKVEAGMEGIKETSIGTGDNAFKQLNLDIDVAKDKMSEFTQEIDFLTTRDKSIDTLNKKLSGLFKFESMGLVSSEKMEQLKDGIESLSNAKTPDELKVKFNQLEKEINQVDDSSKLARESMRGLGNESHGIKKLSDALAKMGIYFSAWRITSEIFQEFKRGMKVVSEVDNQIVQVGIDMNVTAQESKNLLKEAQRIAVETGIGIEEIVRVAGVYSNQTETMASVMAKVKPSAILAGIADSSATEITDMFQGVVNQYKLATDDIEGLSYRISDSIIGVSKNIAQNFDTSVKEISEVLLDAGAVMNELGYTYQETMAMAGAVMEVTRQTGSELGGAFRMTGARIGGAKNAGEDIDPEEISNAAKAYKSIGIEIVDTDGNFKDMKDTLRELNQVWGDLSEVERSYIAEMSAGNRRRNTFMVMMDTMQKQTDLTTIALNSQGDTLAANEKYLTSTAAKVQNFTNALDTLWQNTIDSNFLKNIIEVGTGIIRVTDAIGGMNSAVLVFSAYLTISGKLAKGIEYLTGVQVSNMIATKASSAATATDTVVKGAADVVTKKLTVSSVALGAALTFGLSFAITTVITLLSKLISSYKSADEKAKEFAESVQQTGDQLAQVEKIRRQIEFKEIAIKNTDDIDERIEKEAELLELRKQMAEILPESSSTFDDYGNAIAGDNELIKAQIDLKKENLKLDAEAWLATKGYSEEALNQRNAEADALEERLRTLQEYRDEGKETFIGQEKRASLDGTESTTVDVKKNVAEEYKKVLEEIEEHHKDNAEYVKYISIVEGENVKTIELKTVAISESVEEQEDFTEEVKESSKEMGVLLRSAEKLDEDIANATDEMKNIQGVIDEIDDKDFGGISSESVEMIIEKYPELIQFINDEKTLRQELMKLYDKEKQTSSDALSVKLANMQAEGKANFQMMNKKVENDAEWYRVNVKNNAELIKTFNSLYGLDLRNYNTLAQAKTKSDIGFIENSIRNYNGFFSQVINGYNQIAAAADRAAIEANRTKKNTGMLIETDYDGGTGLYKSKLLSDYRKISAQLSGLNAISWSGVNPAVGTGSGSASGKDSEKTKYESDKAYFNKHTALIEEYQRQLDILANKIDTTTERIAYYKEVGNDASLNNALMLQNRLYQEQTDKLNLLKNAQAGMASGQKEINDSMSKLGINMSTQTAEDLNYWLDKLYPQITSTNQAIVDAQNAKREQFKIAWDSYTDYASELVSIESEIVSMQGTLLDTLKDKYDTEFTIIDRRLENFNKRTEEIARRMQLLNDSSSYNERESLTTDSLSSLTAYKTELEVSIKGLKDKLSMLNSASAEWTIINEKLKEYEGILHETNVEILQTQQNLKSIRDEELSNSMSLLDKIASSVRKQYEEAKKAELAALKATLDAEVDVKRKELKILQDRLDALNDTTEDKESELKALKDEAKMWENDNSVYAKSKLAELEKLIKEKEKDLEKDRIQKEMDNLEDEIQKTEDANQEKVDAVEETYEKLLSEQNIYHQASLILMNSSQEEILKLLLEYDDKYKGMGSVLGKAFAEGLMEEVLKGLDSFDSLSDGLVGKNMIPWMQSLPSGYSYNASGSVNAKSIGVTSQIGIPSIPMDTQLESLSANYLKMMSELGNFKSSIENMTLNMDVKFYTNGQLDVERSIKSLEGLFQDSLAGSGSMFKLNR